MTHHSSPKAHPLPLGIVILHEDRDILAINKPGGLLTISTEKERERTAYHIMTDYVRKGAARSRNRIFIVHRLDRDTSGVLLFAKTEAAKLTLQEHWDAVSKRYLAVTHGAPPQDAGIVENLLAENRAQIVHATTDPAHGKPARTAWRVLRRAPHSALLEIELLTGRKNQIRVHLAGLGCPIVGDRKYGRAEGKRAPLALHAFSITFPHPYSGAMLTLEAPPPEHIAHMLPRAAGPGAEADSPQPAAPAKQPFPPTADAATAAPRPPRPARGFPQARQPRAPHGGASRPPRPARKKQ